MTEANENTISPRPKRPIYLSSWLVALAALGLYGVTLNHWVTFGSLPFASQFTGWDWHPGPLPWRPDVHYQPLFLILTLPLRWLPADWRVLGLNVFTALCAALTLAILARSVALLAHDRTKEQRVRMAGQDARLSVRAAFLPAAFAVLLLAGQLTFWENAIVGTGEMVDLMVFAFLILCLLEYRISQRAWRLSLLAFVYGAGVANNWGLIGFFPCFLLALIWIQRARFFEWRFVLRMMGWGFLGLLLYGLTPLLGALHHDGAFWGLLHDKMAEQHFYLLRLPRYFVAIAAMPTLLPLFFAAIYWPSTEGDLSAGAHDLTRLLFRLLHVGFLAIGVLMFFDVKISASPRRMGFGVVEGVPTFLSFYYLAALSVGYFSGYVLLVFGKEVEYRWGQAAGLVRSINLTLTGLLWSAVIGLPVLLFWWDYPHIRDYNNPVVAQFGIEMAKSLPARPAIVLADDPYRLYLAMGAARRLGLTNQYTFIESRELIHREYLRYLADRYPSFRGDIKSPDRLPDEISSRSVGDLLAHLAQRGTVYYLHPSCGSYFEEVCMTPYRLGGFLHPYPSNVMTTLVLTQEAIVTNQAYWHALQKGALATLTNFAKTGPDGLPERSADAVRVANYYSQMLNCWGTDLQKAATELHLTPQVKSGMLNDASNQFQEAILLNPNNVIARANLQYNPRLRGEPAGLLINTDQLAAEIDAWDIAIDVYGPADVPALDLSIGGYFAHGGDYRQAAHLFQRCLELATNDPSAKPDLGPAELGMAKTYIDMGLPDSALGILHGIPETAGINPLERVRVEAMAYGKKNEFATVDRLLTEARGKNPKEAEFAGVTAEFYKLMGYSVLKESNGDTNKEKGSVQWFQKSLAARDDELRLLNDPIKVTAHAAEIPLINLQRIEMQMMLKDYSNAIVTSSTMLRQNPEYLEPLLDRAISELDLGRLDAAKTDYQALEKTPGPSYKVYFGLAQVAQKQNDKKAEIHYDQLYLKYAPHNTAEYTNINQQLRKLEGR
jgi:tetratricopeptide (TPR) repeat protein